MVDEKVYVLKIKNSRKLTVLLLRDLPHLMSKGKSIKECLSRVGDILIIFQQDI